MCSQYYLSGVRLGAAAARGADAAGYLLFPVTEPAPDYAGRRTKVTTYFMSAIFVYLIFVMPWRILS